MAKKTPAPEPKRPRGSIVVLRLVAFPPSGGNINWTADVEADITWPAAQTHDDAAAAHPTVTIYPQIDLGGTPLASGKKLTKISGNSTSGTYRASVPVNAQPQSAKVYTKFTELRDKSGNFP